MSQKQKKVHCLVLTDSGHTVHCEVLAGNGQTLKDSSEYTDTEETTVQCGVLSGSGQNLEDSSGHSDTETKDGTVSGTDRQWTECRRQQWT